MNEARGGGRQRVTLTIVTIGTAMSTIGHAAGATIRFLGPIPGQQGSIPHAVSADGSTVVGESLSAFGPLPIKRAARWEVTETGAFLAAQELGTPTQGAWAEAVNFDGTVVVGKMDAQSFRWTEADGLEELNPFGASAPSIAMGVSANGEAVFGWANAAPEAAFRWTLAGGYEVLGMYRATGCTADGLHASGWTGDSPGDRRAMQWSNGSAAIVGGIGSYAYEISSGTNPIVMIGYGGAPYNQNGQMVMWINGALVPLPAGLTALAISGDGRTVGGYMYVPGFSSPRAVLWTAERGIVDLNTYLPSIGISLQSPYWGEWELTHVTALSYDGQVVAGYGELGGGFLNGFVVDASSDTDGDGLFDDWERNGIPYFETDGSAQRYVLPGANWLRKDVYVEVDAMTGMAPAQATLNRVVEVFSLAPVPAVPDHPGALPGISLHAELDDIDIPARYYVQDDGWQEFQADKELYFGTGTDSEQRLKAKAKAYRYCIFAQHIPSLLIGRALGTAEIVLDRPANGPRMGGNDFMFGFDGYIVRPGFTLESLQAATFMHELGHSLGLYHGGGYAFLNHNPNHYSVMNYSWAGLRAYLPGDHVLLDYDRHALPPLSEYFLDESAGIGGGLDLLGVFAPVVVRHPSTPGPCPDPLPPTTLGRCHASFGGPDRCVRYFSMSGPVDWNNDGVISAESNRVCADPNGDLNVDDLLSGPLTSVNEWGLLAYNFRDSPYFSNLATMIELAPCPSVQYEDFLASLPPPPPPADCPGPSPSAGAPSPTSASYCTLGEAPKFRITPLGTDPFTVQWRWLDESQDPPEWVDLVEGGLPNGALVIGAQDGTLQIVNAQQFGTDVLRLSCRVTDTCGQTSDSSECTLQVGALALSATSATSVIGCPGGSASFSVATSGPSGPFYYQWLSYEIFIGNGVMPNGTIVSGINSPTLTFSNINPADFRAMETLFCGATDFCQFAEAGPFTFWPRGVAITSQPESLSLPCFATGPAELSVTAEGTALSYAWRKDGAALSDGGRISGATAATLVIDSPSAADAGYYDCQVTSACGSDTTGAAYVDVGPPLLWTDPPETGMACMGGYAFMYSNASGSAPLTFQWRKDGLDLQDDERINGSQTSFLSIGGLQPGDLGSYTLRVTNECGEAISQPITIPVFPDAAITGQPADVETCPNATVLLQVETTIENEGWTYRWERENPGAPGQWLTLHNGQQLTQGVSGVCATMTGVFTPILRLDWESNLALGCTIPHRFRCRVSTPCALLISDVAAVTLVAGGGTPVIQTMPEAGYACAGGTAVLDVVAGGLEPLTYQWHRDAQPLSGQTLPTLMLTGVTPADSGDYTVVVANQCGATTTPAALLTVTPAADANCDGVVNNFDIDPFVAAILEGPAAWAATYGCDFTCVNDVNRDSMVNNFDIDPFVACVLAAGCPTP